MIFVFFGNAFVQEQEKKLKPKRRPGRPSRGDVTSQICEMVIELMSTGMSQNELALTLYKNHNISYYQFEKWKKLNDDFKNAIRIGTILSQGHWEGVGRTQLINPKFNNILYMMNMSNRFGWQRDPESKPELQLTQKNQLNITNVKNLDTSELKSIVDIVAKLSNPEQPVSASARNRE